MMGTGLATAKLVETLAQINGAVNVVLTAGTVVIPLGKALVRSIRSAFHPDTQEVTYELVLQLGTAELDTVISVSKSDLAEINAELERLGQAPLSVPE